MYEGQNACDFLLPRQAALAVLSITREPLGLRRRAGNLVTQ